MVELEKLNNKQFAIKLIKLLIENDCLDGLTSEMLTDKAKCKRKFPHMRFSILKRVPIGANLDEYCYDDRGSQRYYKDIIQNGEDTYIVTNMWYGPLSKNPDNKTPFMDWVLRKCNIEK